MIDRLRDLRLLGKAGDPIKNESQNEIIHSDGVETYNFVTEGISTEFFEMIRSAKAMMGRIQDNSDKILQLRGNYNKAIKASQEKEVSENIDSIIAENRQIYDSLKIQLDDMKKAVEEAETDEQEKDEPQTRMKRNFYTALTNQLTKVLEQERIQEDGFKNCVKERIGRQVRLIDSQLTDDQVQHYVNNPLEAEKMLQEKIYGHASVNLQNAVSDIQDKFKDIQKLERSVAECLQLFKELAILVKQQGQLIDNIQMNVNQAKDYVQKAVQHLQKAKQHHKCAKKYMCCLIIVGLVVLLVILVPIIVVFTKK